MWNYDLLLQGLEVFRGWCCTVVLALSAPSSDTSSPLLCRVLCGRGSWGRPWADLCDSMLIPFQQLSAKSTHVDRSQLAIQVLAQSLACCCVPQAVLLPLNEFCHSTGTGNFAKGKGKSACDYFLLNINWFSLTWWAWHLASCLQAPSSAWHRLGCDIHEGLNQSRSGSGSRGTLAQ